MFKIFIKIRKGTIACLFVFKRKFISQFSNLFKVKLDVTFEHRPAMVPHFADGFSPGKVRVMKQNKSSATGQ